ncbi:MAG TPA: Holliday junction resolvase RuvX [Terriglobales bacterium]|nr:Holliday junction resolvase RuvX [Terriglobales bacterium]
MAFGSRILALDVGKRRIGVAVSDGLGITAQGLATLERQNRGADLSALRGLAEQYEIRLWLVGLPLHMSGEEGRAAREVRQWGTLLERSTKVPVAYWDERLTTVEAERVLRSASSTLLQRRRAVDKMSAVILLQSYLDSQSQLL